MNLKIMQKKEEPLLSRIMVESEIVFDKATPSNQEVKTILAKDLGKDEKLLDIKGIYTLYGSRKAKVLCYAYDNEEILKRIKIKPKKVAEKKEEKTEAKQEQKKGEKKEAKQEEKKTEKKVEEKKESKKEKSE